MWNVLTCTAFVGNLIVLLIHIYIDTLHNILHTAVSNLYTLWALNLTTFYTEAHVLFVYVYKNGMCIWSYTPKNVLRMIFVYEIASDCHDTASSSSLPSSPHSKSFVSVPPLLECPGQIFHLARRWLRQGLQGESPGENTRNGFLAIFGCPSPYTLQANFQLSF